MKDKDEVVEWIDDYMHEGTTKERYDWWKKNFIMSRSKEQLFDIIEELCGL